MQCFLWGTFKCLHICRQADRQGGLIKSVPDHQWVQFDRSSTLALKQYLFCDVITNNAPPSPHALEHSINNPRTSGALFQLIPARLQFGSPTEFFCKSLDGTLL